MLSVNSDGLIWRSSCQTSIEGNLSKLNNYTGWIVVTGNGYGQVIPVWRGGEEDWEDNEF